MALNVDTQDLANYPGNNKRVTLDVNSLVPYGYEGDEQIVMVVSTTAYSDIASRTAISDLYITEAKSGWIKSSGFKGSVFQLDTDINTFRIALDTTVSGYMGSFWYDVELADDGGSNLPGVQVAADMETKIRAIPEGGQWNVGDNGLILAYRNCSVEFVSGKFKIISGSITDSYTGLDKSAVAVSSGTSNDCLSMLGFDITIDTKSLAETQIKEAELLVNYTAGGSLLETTGGTGAVVGDAMAIKGSGTPEYFIVGGVNAAGSDITISGSLSSSYTANETKVQLLRMNDPEFEPTSAFGTVDSIGRYGIKNMVNQIDYSA
jgi:hypothetical protein